MRSSAPESMKTSNSCASSYCGRPLSVLRVICGSEMDQPNPNGLSPAPELYDSSSWGANPERPGLTQMGTVEEPAPETGLALNFSPIPRMAPPPLGNEIWGKPGPDASFDCPLASPVSRWLSIVAIWSAAFQLAREVAERSEEHTSELQS